MSTATAQAEPKPKTAARQPRRISLNEFLRNYSDKEDGYKYEWNNGLIEKTKAMNQQQANFFFTLLEVFQDTLAAKNGGGMITETDMFTSTEQMRRPDIAFYTGGQRRLMKNGETQIAPWLAEVISPSDNADKIFEKLEEYFRAGVQVVWHIYPTSKQVYVYTTPENVTICKGKTICSGAPALPDFEISADDLFA